MDTWSSYARAFTLRCRNIDARSFIHGVLLIRNGLLLRAHFSLLFRISNQLSCLRRWRDAAICTACAAYLSAGTLRRRLASPVKPAFSYTCTSCVDVQICVSTFFKWNAKKNAKRWKRILEESTNVHRKKKKNRKASDVLLKR